MIIKFVAPVLILMDDSEESDIIMNYVEEEEKNEFRLMKKVTKHETPQTCDTYYSSIHTFSENTPHQLILNEALDACNEIQKLLSVQSYELFSQRFIEKSA